ncbi:MAG: NAD-dependent epimerase/dehydratase family protein [Lentisphaeria bacterium]|nr:NAD-dependent epimerase/dehydratase family protein [Lentisphaeria bacterium]
MRKRRILILGGSGFLSGTIARRALENGDSVWTVTRGQRPAVDGVTSLVADRADTGALREAVASAGVRFDAVIDCIGYKPQDAVQDLELFPGLAAHLVFVSTDFVFDPSQRRFPQNDDNDAYLTDDGYGANKRQCEELLIAAGVERLPWTVLRACHIYGSGSKLGCLPEHSRDEKLIERLRAGERLRLVGGGHFLQQPVFARDLADIALACSDAPKAIGKILHTVGPEILESREYYQIIADELGVKLAIEEVPVSEYLAAHPEHASFLCHRIYRLDAIAAAGLPLPSTSMREGLREHVRSLLA